MPQNTRTTINTNVGSPQGAPPAVTTRSHQRKRQASNVDETVNKRPKQDQDDEEGTVTPVEKSKQPPRKGSGKGKQGKNPRWAVFPLYLSITIPW